MTAKAAHPSSVERDGSRRQLMDDSTLEFDQWQVSWLRIVSARIRCPHTLVRRFYFYYCCCLPQCPAEISAPAAQTPPALFPSFLFLLLSVNVSLLLLVLFQRAHSCSDHHSGVGSLQYERRYDPTLSWTTATNIA